MPEFPATPRVLYRSNPLDEVICQVRFPPILRIDAEVPAQFQDGIRGTFPDLRESRSLDLPVGAPPELAEALTRALAGRSSYDFVSDPNFWIVSLTRDFLALTSKRYSRWEEFRAYLENPLAQLATIYRPSHFSRVGLRYRDLVSRRDLGLEDVAWGELLAPPIAGVLGDERMRDGATEVKAETLIRLSPGAGSVRIRYGLAVREERDEVCFLLDSDFFVEERVETGDALGILDRFNREAGRLFRWAISDRLHETLGPRAL